MEKICWFWNQRQLPVRYLRQSFCFKWTETEKSQLTEKVQKHLFVCVHVCSILCDPMNCSPPGSSVHGILCARILEWVAISFSRGIFPTQGLTLSLLSVLYGQVDSLPLAPPGKPTETSIVHAKIYILYGSTFVVYEKQIWSFTMR